MKNLLLMLSCLPLFLFAQQADAQSKSFTTPTEKATYFKTPLTKEMAKRLLPPPDKKYYDSMTSGCQVCKVKNNDQPGPAEIDPIFCITLQTDWGPVQRCFYNEGYCDTFLWFDLVFCSEYPDGW